VSSTQPEFTGLSSLEEMVAFLDQLGARHDVVRTGERKRIPWPLRLAVLIRDGSTCRHCSAYVRSSGAELDHIHPWSAGGPDDSTNLRVLCHRCNTERSNWKEADEPARQPVTWWCASCDPADAVTFEGIPVLQSWYVSADDDEIDRAWDAIRLLREPVLAFCARCDGSGYARWIL
jgi:hypothetical protein